MAKLSRSASGLRHLRWAREIAASLDAHARQNYLLDPSQAEAIANEAALLRAHILTLHNAVKPYRDYLETAHVELRGKQRVGSFLCEEAQRGAVAGLRVHRRDLHNRAACAAAWSEAQTDRAFAGGVSRALFAGHQRTVALAESLADSLRALPSSIAGAATLAEGVEKAAAWLQQANDQRATVEEPRRRPLKAAVERAIGDLHEGVEHMEGRLGSQFPQALIDSLYPELTWENTRVADEDDEDDDASAAPRSSASC